MTVKHTAWKVSKYGTISGLYFPVLGLNTGKYWQEKTAYLDNFHAKLLIQKTDEKVHLAWVKKIEIVNSFISVIQACHHIRI